MQLRWKLKYPAALQSKAEEFRSDKRKTYGFYRVQVLCIFGKKRAKNKISTIFASSEG